jgi:uncharacterized protein (TIGR03067 family)
MKNCMVLAVIAGFATIGTAQEAPAAKMLKDLEGTWQVAKLHKAGEEAPEKYLKSMKVKLKGNVLELVMEIDGKDDAKTATIVLDPAQKPVAIDMTPKDGPSANVPVLGIISVEKDEVKLCFCDSKAKQVRPKEFSSTKENLHLLLVLKKQ